ncbi:hypothetical protein [Dethiothermospora halolimnae]|uniref:hypothetical protein n=1 Tax=Dethiothermospora halolimnae TaxID=3114390 RepID=UPI003CCB97D4
MSKEVNKLVKKYYSSLIVLLVIYLMTVIVLGTIDIINIKDNTITLLAISVLYYLIVKNSLAKYYKGKINEVSPKVNEKDIENDIRNSENDIIKKRMDINKKGESGKEYNKKIKWCKSPTLIYIVIMLIIAIIYRKLT